MLDERKISSYESENDLLTKVDEWFSTEGQEIADENLGECYMDFADPETQGIASGMWGANGKLTYTQAMSVTSLPDTSYYGQYFMRSAITSFNELQYFKNVVNIGVKAFSTCLSLKYITIPENVISIGMECFYVCTSLARIIMKPKIPPTLGASVFEETPSGMKIYVPDESLSTYRTATNWSAYASQIVKISTLT